MALPLGHIGVKRIKKLHADGLLESLDYESFDACEPCLMGKMTKTPFSETMGRANDLEAIIKLLFYISLYHDKCLLFMLELY